MLEKSCQSCNCKKSAQITEAITLTEVENIYELNRQNKEYKELVLNILKITKEIEEPDRYEENTFNYYRKWAGELETLTYYIQKRIELFLLTERIENTTLEETYQ